MKFPSILFFLLAFFSWRDSLVYDKPSAILSANSMAVMVPAKATYSTKAETYRFSVSIETTPGEGCEYDTVLYFLRSYTNIQGLSAGLRQEVVIHKSTVTSTAELPAVTFRTKSGTQIMYQVDYMIGGKCAVRPTYKVFPVLEKLGR